MIYPTRTAVVAALLGAPVALLVAIAVPAWWPLALSWPLAVVLLCLVDGAATRGQLSVTPAFPRSAYVGDVQDGEVAVTLPGRAGRAQVALGHSPLVGMDDDGRVPFRPDVPGGREGKVRFRLDMLRRGTARFDRLWLRWTGRLGLTWRQREIAIDRSFPIVPDLRPLKRHGIELFKRYSIEGQVQQLTRGDGSDFDSLVEYRPGMDRRAIDWKQSAKNVKLLAKLYHGERSSQLLFAIDSGRTMCDPIGGLPRVDRAIAAALLTGWVALKLGDRVSLFSFDSRPRLNTGLVSGARAFTELQDAAATIDYSSEESNYPFALSQLSARLARRSMVVLFTEITDETSADFLIRALRPLLARHLVLAVVLKDDELEELADAPPHEADDVTRSVTAAALLKDRAVIINRLRHLGVDVIESEYDRVGVRLAEAYLGYKKRAAM